MKLILALAFSISAAVNAFAQTDSIIIFKGTVIDSLKKEPLSYVTVGLIDSASQQLKKSTLTKENGTFELKTTIGKNQRLLISSIGYVAKTINLKSRPDLGIIYLSAAGKELKAVVIEAAKPIIKQEVDRISYGVQNDPENKVLTVLDMLKKVPMITVDGTDNIRLKGNTNYKILINNRESALVAQNPSDVFKSMPASNIEKIEVITNPPAKYDAEGLAGIINIITKKNMDQGYNGSLNSRYNSLDGPGINLNATVKQKKIGLSGYVGFNDRVKQTTSYGNSNIVNKPIITTLNQNGLNTRSGRHAYGSAELSYEIDTLNLLTATYQQYFGANKNRAEQWSNEYDSKNVLAQYYRILNENNYDYNGTDLGLNYQLGFKRSKDQTLTASYRYKLSSNTQNTEGIYAERLNYGMPNYKQYNNSGSNEHTAQIDFVFPIKKLNLETGAKTILRNNFSDFENYRQLNTTSDFVIDPSQSKDFDYFQNVYSLYNSYQYKMEKWVAKGGLRLELTTIGVGPSLAQSTAKNEYNNLIPSISIQRVLNKTSNITLGYSQRIQRPGIWQLNPFTEKSNPKLQNKGNPDLKPVTNQSFELKYSNFAKGSINLGLGYSFANNTIESVMSVTPDSITIRSFENVGTNDRLSLDANINYTLFKKLSLSINAALVHVGLSGTFNGITYNNRGFQGYIFSYNSYKFNKGFNMGFNIGYDSRYVYLQGRDNDWFFYSLSASKELIGKKLSVGANIDNAFNRYRNIDFYNSNAEFSQRNNIQLFARRASVSLNYKFGKLNADIKKNKRGINNDDVSGGGR